MPVLVQASGERPFWTKKQSAIVHGSGTPSLRIAFVNNMPDSALEDTELQFFDLLDAASDQMSVVVQLYSLTGVRRNEQGLRRVNTFYYGLDELWKSPVDAMIITGTEPQQPSLRQEPYWPHLTNLLEWAGTNTHSTVLSCLAAHAAVLHGEGIERHRLDDKRSGVFEFATPSGHALMQNAGTKVRFPHSRWNELRADELKSGGYTILTQSEQAGVDCFVKHQKQSMFVHFQGHPEYQAHTLFKEYRRDVRRYLRRERDSYPAAPAGYFGDVATNSLLSFREAALANRNETLMNVFPEASLTGGLQNSWRESAVKIYGNWLTLVSETKAERFRYAPVGIRSGADTLRWME
jgi:homoserine O-succinyltransferase/O-acetyltransferase